MMFSRVLILTALGLFASIAGCAEPTTRTTTASETTTTTASGGETHTNVNETREQGSDGHGTVRRSETIEQTTPAPTPAPR